MRVKLGVLSLSAFALLWVARPASAGVVRAAGEGIGKGSVAVAQTTANAAQTAAGGVATVGKETPGVVKSGAVGVGKGAAAAPRLAYRGTTTAAKKVWKVIW
jgi:hypothetical protein